MIYSYGVSLQGKAHIKSNTVCQDAHLIKKISNDKCLAAVADGLGSEPHSDIGSKLAVESIIGYCESKITNTSSDEEILNVIKAGYAFTYKEICKKAEADGNPSTEYDSTLIFVCYNKDKIYFGHSGDSGIVALLKSGEFVSITKQQRDDNGYVFPLSFQEDWVFGIKDGVASVLLVTDGMLETLFPSLLFNEPVPIYVALAQYFMDNRSLGFNGENDNTVQKKICDFVENIGESQVSDDKTVVCLLNTDVVSKRKEDDYYKVPDWAALKKKKDEEFRRLAYPHLYKNEDKKSD